MTHSVQDDVSPKEKPSAFHNDGHIVEQEHDGQKDEHDRPIRRNRFGGRGRRGDYHDPNFRYNVRMVVRSRAERGRDRVQSGERATRRRSYSDSYHIDNKQRDEGAGGDDRHAPGAERQVRNNGDFRPRRRFRGGYGGGRGRYGGDVGYNRRPPYRRRYRDEESDERLDDKRQTSEPPTRSSSESKDHKAEESKKTGEQEDKKKHESPTVKDKRQSHKSKSKRRESNGKSRRSPQPMLNESVLLHVFGTMDFETRCKAETVCHEWRRVMTKVTKPAADAPKGVTVLVKTSAFESRQVEPIKTTFDRQHSTITVSYRPRRYPDVMYLLVRHLEKLNAQLGAGLEHIRLERLAISSQILFAIGANLQVKSMHFFNCFFVGAIDFATLHSFMLYFKDRMSYESSDSWETVVSHKNSVRRTPNRRRFQKGGRDGSAAKSTPDGIAEDKAADVAAGPSDATQALEARQ